MRIFSSTDPQTVWVGDDGQIISLEPGTATITATTKDGATDWCRITVNNTYQENVQTEETSQIAIGYHYAYPLSLKAGQTVADCTFKSQEDSNMEDL